MNSAESTSVQRAVIPLARPVPAPAPDTARVIAFPGKAWPGTKFVYRFSTRDRITALDWANSAQRLGYTRVVFEAAEDVGETDTGEFLLVYAEGASWASWGIGCGSQGMTLWHSARGTTIGRFATLTEALGRIQEHGARI